MFVGCAGVVLSMSAQPNKRERNMPIVKYYNSSIHIYLSPKDGQYREYKAYNLSLIVVAGGRITLYVDGVPKTFIEHEWSSYTIYPN